MHWVFFFNDTATTEIYTLSLHDALPICAPASPRGTRSPVTFGRPTSETPGRSVEMVGRPLAIARSEEHTSELQSRQYLVCRLLLEKKKVTLRITIQFSASPTCYRGLLST